MEKKQNFSAEKLTPTRFTANRRCFDSREGAKLEVWQRVWPVGGQGGNVKMLQTFRFYFSLDSESEFLKKILTFKNNTQANVSHCIKVNVCSVAKKIKQKKYK